ncbi:uncharacterized protein EI90DRAFT_2676523 [Cantharellus anzutake]|uniref:uncharacterized protein n=1 Tax=Cantharellus anzutake TaxID=1750568 RepID=UPI001906F51F|nr:uncharacterized protein EI90DRAFT_2676523 [Cantharellus anzutake]KAF8319465.1 hypothetical protein EI90DRAFT_2676523 [Cantharellus anzutake]
MPGVAEFAGGVPHQQSMRAPFSGLRACMVTVASIFGIVLDPRTADKPQMITTFTPRNTITFPESNQLSLETTLSTIAFYLLHNPLYASQATSWMFSVQVCPMTAQDGGVCGKCREKGWECQGYGEQAPGWTKDQVFINEVRATLMNRADPLPALAGTSEGAVVAGGRYPLSSPARRLPYIPRKRSF